MESEYTSRTARDEEVGRSDVDPADIARYRKARDALHNSRAVPPPAQLIADATRISQEAQARRQADDEALQAELRRQDQSRRS